jgi:hypothetical protein
MLTLAQVWLRLGRVSYTEEALRIDIRMKILNNEIASFFFD